MIGIRKPPRAFVLAALLGIAILAAFWPLFNNDFVSYDDFQYVKQNPHLARGLGWGMVKCAFRPGYAANWHPLTWLVHAFNVSLFGLNPRGHHFTSLLLHI